MFVEQELQDGAASTRFDVETLIPHAPPMRMIETITDFDASERTMEATKRIGENEHFVQGHYPGFPIVPGVITCECIFQTGAALLSALSITGTLAGPAQEGKVPVVARANNIKFKGVIRPGDSVVLQARLSDVMGSAYYLTGTARVEGKLKASLDFSCMYAKVEA